MHGGILNIRRVASPLVRLEEGEERWEASDHLQGVLPQNWLARLSSHESIADAGVDDLPLGRSCIKAPLHAIHGPADIDELTIADISTPVTVSQRAANCLEEAVRSFTIMRSRCQTSRADVTFLHPLPVFRVVRCLSVPCFQTRIAVELFRCTRTPIPQ
ncbi:uncharacterized protein TNCV_2787011 [Trichonephila clavipes]|nr:uncharacterized protein TNCV_2787011 [Trichonephila clavipes]